MLAANSFGAAPRGGGKKSGAGATQSTKLEDWKRDVKKLESVPVAEGFVAWKGFDTIKCARNARWLAPGDLRGRFAIVVEIDEAKFVEQLKATLWLVSLGFASDWLTDWDFAPISRDVVVVYNVYGVSEWDLLHKVFSDKELRNYNFYGHVTFDGAPDSATERPYVYVMGPEGKEPIYKGKYVKTKTGKDIRAAIQKASSELSAWRPWYGYVTEVKHVKGFDAAVKGGKALAQFEMTLKKGVSGKNAEVAAESQRLYDAIEQRKGDLLFQIRSEWSSAPCAALYDIEELTKRFPRMKRDISVYSDRIAKAHPDIAKVYKHYALYRRCADPAFQLKNAGEVKKQTAELSKSKSVLATLADNKDNVVQNMAAKLPSLIDNLIEELPTKVVQK